MNQKNETQNTQKSLTIIGIVLCVILIPILIVNCTLIVKSMINKDDVPSIGGRMPLIVLTDSMYPDIKSGDIIICKTIDAEDVEVGDVISFYDPAGNGMSVVTHEVIEIIEDGDSRSFRTKGINNNTEDRLPVPANKVIAEYTGVRIPVAGNVAIFMQSTAGLIVCVIVPIILLVGYDVIRRRKYEQSRGDDLEALKAELEALKAEKAAKSEQTEQNEAVATEAVTTEAVATEVVTTETVEVAADVEKTDVTEE